MRDRKSGSAGMPLTISYGVLRLQINNDKYQQKVTSKSTTKFILTKYAINRALKSFPTRRSSDLVTVADVLAAQPVTTNLLKFMRASIKMIGVSNLQSFIASMTQKLTLSDISDESKNYLDKAGITTACLRIKSKWTAGGK